jgi:squalene-hopene/tetraprenyl-beta-curcumene cyclase
MHVTRRGFLLQGFSAAAAVALLGCQRISSPKSLPPTAQHLAVEKALNRAIEYFAAHQDNDGSWKSDTYGVFKDGTALTPLVLHAAMAVDSRHPIVDKAAGWLANWVDKDGSIRPPSYGFDFALYMSALAVTSFSDWRWNGNFDTRPGGTFSVELQSWLKYLKERQLTEELGWKPEDKEYGGWGYCRTIPRKGKAGEINPPLLESNLSATTFALGALRAARLDDADPAFAKALIFVKRCQNWNDVETKRDNKFDDGGFHFIYDDPVRNKAGVAGKDAVGAERHFSYGSTTADGLRCLLLGGEKESSQRVFAAKDWLKEHFQADSHPGTYDPKRELDRQATYYYYAASVAQARLDRFAIEGKNKQKQLWLAALGEALLGRQRDDGSWSNPAHAFREDEPLVATPFAVLALVQLRNLHRQYQGRELPLPKV